MTAYLPSRRLVTLVGLLFGFLSSNLFALSQIDDDKISGLTVSLRLMTETQYRNTVSEIFGEDIVVSGSFEPGFRKDGLLSVGNTHATVSVVGLERSFERAQKIAKQVAEGNVWRSLPGCTSVNGRSMPCANSVAHHYGRLAWRRGISKQESDTLLSAAMAPEENSDIQRVVSALITSLLISPNFLFIAESLSQDGESMLGYSIASRMSYLLWNTTPDHELLTEAEKGTLVTREGRERVFARMAKSQKLERGIRAFFEDYLGFDRFDRIEKDPLIYPIFTQATLEDAREQTLLTILKELIEDKNSDYRDIFTTRDSFIRRSLGPVYRVPVRSSSEWEPITFPESTQRYGIFSQSAFLALHSHPGRSSPTLRGQAIREQLMCQPVAPPPNNVDFALVEDTNNEQLRTARQRLSIHNTEVTCKACHKLMDPIGLVLENFDGIGQFRVKENGAKIDTKGDVDDVAIESAKELANHLANDENISACMVYTLYKYTTGKEPTFDEDTLLESLILAFIGDDFNFRRLLKSLSTNEAMYTTLDSQTKAD